MIAEELQAVGLVCGEEPLQKQPAEQAREHAHGEEESGPAGHPALAVRREAAADATDLETVIQDILSGQYGDPFRVVAFNTAEGWSSDVSGDVADELRRRCDLQMRDLPESIQGFVERHEGAGRQLTLRLV